MTFLVWLMIYLSNGIYPKIHMAGYVNIMVLVVACVCYCFYSKKIVKIKITTCIIASMLLALQLVTIVIHGFYPASDLYLMAAIVSALLFTSIVSFNECITAYSKGIFWIAVISSGIHILGLLTPIVSEIPSIFLNTTDSSDTFILLGTFVVRQRGVFTYYRNYGIFSEPGQFQIFLSIALIIELFFRKKPSWKMLVAILAAYITCDSTNGYITGALVVLAYLLNNRVDESKKAKRLRYVLTSIAGVLLVIFLATADSNSFIIGIAEKISGLSLQYSYTDRGTGLERRRAIDVSVSIFLQNPLIGLGYRGMQDYIYNLSSSGFIMTFSPMNWFARFGVIYGFIANAGYLGAFCRKPKGWISKIILCLAVWSMISAQAVGADIFTCVLIFYGFRHLMISNRYGKEQYELSN